MWFKTSVTVTDYVQEAQQMSLLQTRHGANVVISWNIHIQAARQCSRQQGQRVQYTQITMMNWQAEVTHSYD